MEFQPNDVMSSFMILKGVLSTPDYKIKTFQTVAGERVAKEFEVILKAMKMYSASRNTCLLV